MYMKMFSRIMMVFMLMNTILLFAAEQENNDKKIWVDEETGMEINLQHPPMYRLITSTESGGLALLKRCILNGINVNHYDSRGGGNKSLLYLLIDGLPCYPREEAEEVLDLMIKHGVDLKKPIDGNGNTALHKAVRYKKVIWCLEKFIAAGANVNAQNKANESPLHKTIDSSWKYKFYGEAAKILIQHGATIGAVDEYDRIPLYHAVRRISDTKITDKEREAQKKAVAFFLYQ